MDLDFPLDVLPQDRDVLCRLLSLHLPAGTQIWAFGSRVRGTARAHSDLDLVVFTSGVQGPSVSVLRESLEESNLPFRVDLHVWDELPEAFHRQISERYVDLTEWVAGSRQSLSED